jgi:hypothetical protein
MEVRWREKRNEIKISNICIIVTEKEKSDWKFSNSDKRPKLRNQNLVKNNKNESHMLIQHSEYIILKKKTPKIKNNDIHKNKRYIIWKEIAIRLTASQ